MGFNRSEIVDYIAPKMLALEKIALGGAVVFFPFRFRLNLFDQPIPPIFGDYTNGLIFISDVFLGLAFFTWGIRLVLRPEKLHFGPMIISLPLAALMVSSFVSTFVSVNPLISLYHLARLAMLAVLYLWVVNELDSLEMLIWPITGQILLQASVGIAQVLRQGSLGFWWIGELSLDPGESGVSIVWVEGIRSLRAYGLSDHPNILGGCLVIALIIIGSWLAAKEPKWGMILVGVFITGSLSLFLTFSRSAWLGLIAGLLLIFWFFRRCQMSRAVSNWIYLLLGTSLLLSPFVWQFSDFLSFGSNRDNPSLLSSREERSSLNIAANRIFSANAIAGVGLGAAPIALKQVAPDFPYDYQPPHNVLLNSAVEVGIFGAMFYMLTIIAPWVGMWINRRRLNFSPDLIAVSGALAAITVIGFYDYYPWLLSPGRNWQWLLWGLWSAIFLKDLDQIPQNNDR